MNESGKVTFAGAHEDIVIYRAKQGKCEIVPTKGVWLGAQRDVLHLTADNQLAQANGDTMILYTDGVVEARDENGEELGIARFVEEVTARAPASTVSELCDALIDVVKSHASKCATGLADDVTVLVLRHAP